MDDQVAPLPFCACGCMRPVKRHTSKYLQGHHARVNNISKRADIREKRRESMKKRHENGIMPEPWNKGKKAHDDERIAAYGRARSASFTEEEKRQRSETMRENWKTGKIVPLSGLDHSQWNGGTSSITQRIRGNSQLYESWKRPILKRDEWKCRHCGRTVELVVHHNQERFAEIVKKCLFALYPDALERELTWEEQGEIVKRVVFYHVQNDVSGITLCWDCHEKVHQNDKDED